MEFLNVTDYDDKRMRCCCPFHLEDTPSFIYNPKEYNCHCFGSCSQSYDIIDAYMKGQNATFTEAVQKLFELAEIPYSFGDHKVKTKHQYRYPKPVECTDKSKVYAYLATRKISAQTADHLDIRQDGNGNMVFNYYNTQDVLCNVKYRPARKVKHGENKNWCQKDADTTPILFNMNRINPAQPLIITTGELDCASVIEAGFQNAVSVPFGDGTLTWLEECFDWLEQFNEIIVCHDNDDPGYKFVKEIVPRLGSWRCKVANCPEYFINYEKKTKKHIKDINETLFWFGKQGVIDMICSAVDSPIPSLVDLSDVEEKDLSSIDGIETGLLDLDRQLMKLFYGTFNILSGTPGCVDCETEYFNGHKWMKISEYQHGDLVLQYNADGSAQLVQPEAYIKKPCEKMYRFHTKYGIDQCVSPEHRMVYRTSKRNIAIKPAEELVKMHETTAFGFAGKFYTTFRYDGPGIELSDNEIRLMCAVICDAHFPNENSNRCRINIKKKRKQERLVRILDACQIPYEVHSYNPKDPEYQNYLFEAPLHTKSFGDDWYSCSNHQLQVIADEVLYWDGRITKNRKGFYTTDKDSADFIQYAFSATGRRATIQVYDRRGKYRGDYIRYSLEYSVTITDSNMVGITNTKGMVPIPVVKPSDGFKYCFTVPSGMLVLRRNGRINITGNSGKTSWLYELICNTLDKKLGAWVFSRELPDYMTKNWINYLLAGPRNVNQYTSENGTVYYRVSKSAKKAINDTYRGLCHLYRDDYPNDVDALKDSMVDAARKFGDKLFIIDNLMTVNLHADDQNKYDKQTEFVNWLINFSAKFNVCTVLVCHPRKLQYGQEDLEMYDMAGTSNLINLAHRGFALKRISKKAKEGRRNKKGDGWEAPPCPFDAELTILKDRMRGKVGYEIGMYYDEKSRRFFTNPAEYNRQYSWDSSTYDRPLPYPVIDETDEVYGKIEGK